MEQAFFYGEFQIRFFVPIFATAKDKVLYVIGEFQTLNLTYSFNHETVQLIHIMLNFGSFTSCHVLNDWIGIRLLRRHRQASSSAFCIHNKVTKKMFIAIGKVFFITHSSWGTFFKFIFYSKSSRSLSISGFAI